MSPLRHLRSALTDSLVRVLFAADGELGTVRLRMLVEQESKPVPDATWYRALNRLVDAGLVSEMDGRNSTVADVQAVLDTLTNLTKPLVKSERSIISLTRSGRLYALTLRLASLAKPSARQLAERDLDVAFAAASAIHGVNTGAVTVNRVAEINMPTSTKFLAKRAFTALPRRTK